MWMVFLGADLFPLTEHFRKIGDQGRGVIPTYHCAEQSDVYYIVPAKQVIWERTESVHVLQSHVLGQ